MCFDADAHPALPPVFDRKQDEFKDECDDAWPLMLDFMTRHAAA